MTKIVNQQINNIINDIKANNKMIEIDINDLNKNIYEKEKIAYILNNYHELTKKYRKFGIASSIACIIVLGIAIYVFGSLVNASALGICVLELGALTLSILSGVQYALDNEYTKIKKEYNLEDIEKELEGLKENIVAKNNARNNNIDMINMFLQEEKETKEEKLNENDLIIEATEERKEKETKLIRRKKVL